MQNDKETTRIEIFSDGVFAIAVTLLVLEIKLPSHEVVTAHSLAAAWPGYLAFFIRRRHTWERADANPHRHGAQARGGGVRRSRASEARCARQRQAARSTQSDRR
ncbi:DUF1211 domain-containing protein [Methylosinus sporium]